MVLMAIDHASFFIARVHPAETWVAPGEYASFTAFVTRWVTHLSAPGFFLLMGAGMTWLAEARARAGWTPARIRRFFLTRGLVLLLIQQVIENPAWLLGFLSIAPGAFVDPPAVGGSPDGVFVVLLVVSALGASMVFWGLLIRAPALVVAAIVAAAYLSGWLLTPAPSEAGVLFPIPLRVLFIMGTTAPVSVVYPWVPWLVPAGLGVLMGRAVLRSPDRARGALVRVGLGAVAVFVALRLAGLGDYHQPGPGFIGFMNLTKYPPSLDFLLVTLGMNLILAGSFAPARPRARSLAGPPEAPLRSRGSLAPARSLGSGLTHALEAFGRSPLFFYLLHLYVFGALSWAFPRGSSWAVMYLVWAAAVAAMYPACRWYAGFKAGRPIGSFWRLL